MNKWIADGYKNLDYSMCPFKNKLYTHEKNNFFIFRPCLFIEKGCTIRRFFIFNALILHPGIQDYDPKGACRSSGNECRG